MNEMPVEIVQQLDVIVKLVSIMNTRPIQSFVEAQDHPQALPRSKQLHDAVHDGRMLSDVSSTSVIQCKARASVSFRHIGVH